MHAEKMYPSILALSSSMGEHLENSILGGIFSIIRQALPPDGHGRHQDTGKVWPYWMLTQTSLNAVLDTVAEGEPGGWTL